MKSSIHLIGNAHLDPAWLWPWYEGMSEARATFASALERIDEFPEFVFTASAAALYRWVEKTDPALLGRIRKQVKAKRWSIPGGWHTQSDNNIPSGESFARNALYSRNYLRRVFGAVSGVGYTVDTFGHAGSLPQLLKRGGMGAFVFMRPGHNENPDIPRGPFIWEGTDGTRVLCYRLLGGYNACQPAHVASLAETIRSSELPIGMIFYGVGDHGGGPTRALLRGIEKLRKKHADIRYSDPDRFFRELTRYGDRLPVWEGEMQHHAVGCYQAHGGIKRAYRRAVHSVLAAERLAAVSSLARTRRKKDPRIESAWHDILFSDFHDIMGGTCERTACDDTIRQLGRARFTAQEIMHEAAQRIGAAVNTKGPGRAVLVCNPHAFPFGGVIETDDIFIHPAFHELRTMKITDPGGAVVPHQAVPPSTRTTSIRLAFPAALPPLGWKLFRLDIREKGPDSPFEWHQDVPAYGGKCRGTLKATSSTLFNEHIALSVGKTGFIRLRDRKRNWNVFRGEGFIPLVLNDRTDTWSHGTHRFDREAGAFKPVSRERVENGPLRARLRLEYVLSKSSLRMDFILERESRSVRCDCVLDWQETHRMLKFVFPVNLTDPVWTSEIPYGTVTRPLDGDEYPMQKWCDLSAGCRGISILNTGSYSVDGRERSLRITAVRSPVFAHHDPIEATGNVRFQDQGIHEFSFELLPHGRNWRAETARRAELLNGPLILSWEGTHDGSLPKASRKIIAVSADNVMVTALKPAETGGGLIVRAFEAAGVATDVRISLPPLKRTWKASFHGGEVKTFLVPKRGRSRIREVDFTER